MDNLQQLACIGTGVIIGSAATWGLVVLCDWLYPRRR